MASNIDISGLTMNPLEVASISEFIMQKVEQDPILTSIHTIWTGVQMNEQIVLASQLSKTGIKDTTCARPNSGATATLTQKNWIPKNIGDTLIHCQTDVNSLFKAYYTKINQYVDLFDISGSDLDKFFTVLLTESSMKAIFRVAWFGDTAVAQSAAGAAGLVLAADVKFYDQLDGLWKQIFAGVVATTIEHTTTKIAALNAQVTIPLQTTLATDDGITILDDMWTRASTLLRQEPDVKYYVSREIFESVKSSLKAINALYSVDYAMNGLPTIKWDGKDVINMETIWGTNLRGDFEQNSTSNAYYLPNRAVLTIPANIPIATLNENDFGTIESWYEKLTRSAYTAYGFTLDAKVIDEELIVVAY